MFKHIRISVILLFFMYSTSAMCQVKDGGMQVYGKIIGENEDPLSDVSVSIRGMYVDPVITDSTGTFEINVPDGDVWLMINPTELYKPRDIFLNYRIKLVIQLTPGDMDSGSDEVLNVFHSKLRRNMNSSSNSLEMKDSKFYPLPSIDQYLQFEIPGLYGIGRSGMPGSGLTSYMRGFKSLYTNNQPLYIIDGLPVSTPGLFQSELDGNEFNPLSGIDPMDISNITVLKDYLGAAAYGMRASNGIVLIETLKPKEIQTKIDLSFRTGISLEPRHIPQLNANQYKTLANEILNSSGEAEEDFIEQYPALYSTSYDQENYRYNNNTNWQDMVFTNARMNDFHMRVKGGDEIAVYGLSVSYLNHKGIIENTAYDRFSVRFVSNFNIFQWLRMYISSNLSTSTSELRESGLASETSPILTSLFKSPLLIPYEFDDEGSQLKTLENVGPLGVSNPLAVVNDFEGKNKNNQFTTSFRIEGDIGTRLKWNSLLGLNFNSMSENIFMPNSGMELYYDDEAYNVSKSLKNFLNSVYNDNYLSYQQDFGNKHSVFAVAGVRVNTNRFEIDWGISKNSHESDEFKQLQNGTSFLREMGGQNSRWNRLAIYGNAGYSFADRYSIEAGLASENSTRIGKNAEDIASIGARPFGLFPSVGLGWRISGEPFFRDLYWLEELKLRANYGVAGNDDIGNLSALDYYTTVHYRESTGLMPGTISEQDLKHEEYKQIDVGLDLGLLASKIRFTVDYFNIKTNDLLVLEQQPYYIGYETIPGNIGILSNKGIELSLFWRIVDKRNFKWDAGFNLTKLKNSVDEIKGGEVITSFEGGEFISRAGEQVLSFYGYEYQGVFSDSEEANSAGLTTENGVAFQAGDAKFNDRSGPDGVPDGVISDYDKTIIGSPIPENYGNFKNAFRWGSFSLTTILQFVSGNEAFNYVRSQNERMSDLSNQSTHVLDRWFAEGQITDVPRAVWGDPTGNASFSTRWIEDASYLRVKNITLSYTLSEKALFLKNAQVYITATNLYTFTKYLGYDPEFSYSYYTMEQGVDYGLMPHPRQFMVGLKIGL